MECRDVIERLSPYLDDELDPVASGEVSRHLEGCPECAAAFGRQRRLGESLRRDLQYHRAPDVLRARVLRDTRMAGRREEAPSRPAFRTWHWLSVAAAVVIVIGGTWWGDVRLGGRADDAIAGEVVSGHIRSLMASHLTDVASTDQHTVKPWFAGKLDFSPPVTDFSTAGYPLVGGRLDYVQGHPVAALVYLRHKHVINAFVWPVAGAREGLEPATSRRGFRVIHGARDGMAYWLVSDLNAVELAGFARLLSGLPAVPGRDSVPPAR